MSWMDLPSGVFATHPMSAIEMTYSNGDGLAGESWSGASTIERGDLRAPSWETAWIDLGGEG